MNMELLQKVIKLLKENLKNQEEQKKILSIISKLVNDGDFYENFINLSKEEREELFVILGYSEEKINEYEEDIQIVMEPKGAGGGIWLTFYEKSKDRLLKEINEIKDNFKYIISQKSGVNDLYNMTYKFINLLESNKFDEFSIEELLNILMSVSLSEKELLDFIKGVVIENSKYYNSKLTKTKELDDLELKIDDKIDTIIVDDDEVLEIKEVDEIEYKPEENSKEEQVLLAINSQIDRFSDEHQKLIKDVTKYIQKRKNDMYSCDETDKNTVNSYIELCENPQNEELDFYEYIQDFYEMNSTSIFNNNIIFEVFIASYLLKLLDELNELLEIEEMSESDKKMQEELIDDLFRKLKIIYELPQEVRYALKEEKLEDNAPVGDKNKIILYAIEDSSSKFNSLTGNLRTDFKNGLQKLNINSKKVNSLKKEKDIHYLIFNNVIIYYVIKGDLCIVMDVLSTGDNKHNINSIIDTKKSQKFENYCYRLLNDQDFYEEVLDLSTKYYGEEFQPGGIYV